MRLIIDGFFNYMRKLTTEEFIEKAKRIHGDTYDYRLVKYKSSKDLVKIICKKHGLYLKSAGNHTHKTRPQGCPKCGDIRGGVNKTKSTIEKRFKNLTQPNDYKLIPLNDGSLVKVDNKDFHILSKYVWLNNSVGYAKNAKLGLMHRFIMNAHDEYEIDHINHDTLDNRRFNLRSCSHKENLRNQQVRQDKQKRGLYKGVYYHKRYKKWISTIVVNGNRIQLGTFQCPKKAAEAYNKAAELYFGDFSCPNKI